MSGWIALRFLKEPKDAYNHFHNLNQNVTQPVTLARAQYWLGMASEAMKKRDWAIEWYKKAAQYPTFFYGQLAIHKHRTIDPLGAQSDIVLPGDPDITGRDIYNISQSRAAQVAYLLSLVGDKTNSSKIFEWLVGNSPTEGQVAVVMKLVNELRDRQLDAKIARAAARKNVFFIKDKFQIIKEVSYDEYAPLVHAIIKQESGFAPMALSHVGAIGFMQLMPDTAKLVAKEMGVKYDRNKLASNIEYNVQLGSFYIKKLINQFEGSEMLAIASYNAGPNATNRWIKEFYDPRKEKDMDKIIDWIELITYSETRNYVQRIMENLIVYKYLMSRSNYDNIK
jgi:soluble lytic murein transglycosylase